MDKVKQIFNLTDIVSQNAEEIIFIVVDANENPVIDFEQRNFDKDSVQIWTGPGGTGTQLTETTDFVFTRENLGASAKTGKTINNGISITNATYQNVNLYIPVGTLELYGDVSDETDPNRLQDQIDSILSGTNQAGIASIHRFATSKDRTAQGLFIFDYNNPISKSVYSPLWDEVQHSFNAAHVAVGDPDLIALDDGTFYPTPPPGSYGRSGIPDISFTETDISGNALNYSVPTGFRDGTIFRYELLTGTTVVNLVDGTEYYLKRNGAALEVYATEADAIAGTSQILISGGSGTFKFTQSGVAIDDALEEHRHLYARNSSSTSSIEGLASAINANETTGIAIKNVADANVSNETRGTTFYEFAYIKAESVLSNGETLSAQRYVQDWSLCTAWTGGNSIVIAHPFNTAFDEYSGQVFVRDPLVPNKIYNATDTEKSISGVQRGQRLNGIDSDLDNCYLQIAQTSGLYTLDDGTGGVVPTTWEYKIVFIKPTLVAQVVDAPVVVNIADAVDVTRTLPDAVGYIGDYIIKRTGAGTGVVNINTVNSQTIDGLAPTEFELRGDVSIVLFASGGNWYQKTGCERLCRSVGC